jgi:hypothetical protein
MIFVSIFSSQNNDPRITSVTSGSLRSPLKRGPLILSLYPNYDTGILGININLVDIKQAIAAYIQKDIHIAVLFNQVLQSADQV